MAKDGDTIAPRLCLDTMIYPARKDRLVKFALLEINSPRDAANIMVTVAKAVAAGDVTPNEACEFAKVIETYVKAFYVAELDERGSARGAVERRGIDAHRDGRTGCGNRHLRLAPIDLAVALTW